MLSAYATPTKRRDLPDIAPRVAHSSPAIAIEHVCGSFDRFGAGRNGAAVAGIRIRDVDIKERRHRFANAAAVAHHHHRIINPELAGAVGMEFALGVEDSLQEMDETCDITRKEPRRDGTPTIRLVAIGAVAHDCILARDLSRSCAIRRAPCRGRAPYRRVPT